MKSRIALEATVLLVDDDQALLEMSEAALDGHFAKVIASSSPIEALQLAQRNSIDLAILDFQMPGMTGLELLTELRKQQPTLPALLLTGFGSDPKVLQAIQDGIVFDIVDKPYRFENLMNRARNALIQPFLWNLLAIEAERSNAGIPLRDPALTLDQKEELLYRLSGSMRLKRKAG